MTKLANAADQALARSLVLAQADLGPTSVWHGGRVKPDDSFNPACANFHLRQADLILTGEAESRYRTAAYRVADSEVHVLQTATMVRLDFQRNVTNPALLACVREGIAAGGGHDSAAALPLPRIAGVLTGGYRLVLHSRSSNTSVPVPYLLDSLTIARNRTEIKLSVGGAYKDRVAILRWERRLALMLAARLPAVG
jgi:hypothetical protein